MGSSSKDGYSFAISAKNQTAKTFSAIDSDIRKVDVSIKGLASNMRGMASSGVIGIGALGSAAAVAMVGIVSHTAEAAREIDNLSRVANASNEKFQEMAFGARFLGIEQDKLSDILKDVNDKVGDFLVTGGGPMVDFFDEVAPKVGVTAEQFRNLSGPDALQLYVSSLEKANVTQAEMTFYMEAIASDATNLLPLLKDNGAAMNAQAEEARALGLVLSSVDIAILEQTDKQMKKSSEALGAFANQLAVEFAPIIAAVSNELLSAAKEAGGFGNIATTVFDAVVTAAGYVGDTIRGLSVVWDLAKWAVVTNMEVVLSYFDMIETGIRAVLQYVPGAVVSTESFLGGVRESISNVKEQIESDLNAAVSAPLPSESFTIYAEEVKSQAREMAAVVAAAKTGNVTGEGEDEAEDPEIVAARNKMEQLKILKELGIASDVQSEELAFLNKMEMLRVRYEEGELPLLVSYQNLKQGLAQKHEDNLTKISNKGLTERQKFEKKTGAQQTKQVFGELSTLTAGVASHNKGLFELNKVAGIATAVMNTAIGASESLKAYPMPIAAVMAAAHVAAGMAQISAIKSTKFGGGGSSGGAAAAGAIPITTAPSNISLNAAADEKEEDEKKVIQITVNIDPEERYSGSSVREMMERIGEEAGYNVRY